MKAYILESPKNIKIFERKIPDIEDYKILIKVKNIGLCGSDIQFYKGTYSGPSKYPILFGHEWSGIVEKIGKSVTKVKPGDKVTGDCSKYCGECKLCGVDRNLCSNIEKYGITIDGASSEYIIREEKYIYKAPDDLELDLICLTEPISVANHIIKRIKRYRHDIHEEKILICGGGTLGISSLLLLKNLYECRNVYLFDIVDERLELAEELGANILSKNPFLSNYDSSSYDSIYSSSNYDVIIECTGNPKVFSEICKIISPLGTIGCLGMMQEVTILQKLMVIKGLTMIGSIGGTGEFPEVLDFIKNNKKYVKKLISHKINISEINKAFKIAQDVSKSIKVEIVLDKE